MLSHPKKVLGCASYKAQWVHQSHLVRLTATGVLPCPYAEVQLEVRPERVVPQNWNLVFFLRFISDLDPVPFVASAFMTNETGSDAVVVHDAGGLQEVTIERADAAASDAEKALVVFAQLPRLDHGHHGCVIAMPNAPLSAMHYQAFGPAPRHDCEAFIEAQGTVRAPDPPIPSINLWPRLG